MHITSSPNKIKTHSTSARLRILYIVSGLGYGGAEKQLIELAKQMVILGHEVALYTLNDYVPRKKELEKTGVTLIVDQKKAKFDFALLRRLKQYVRDWQPDLLHGFLFDGGFYARLAGMRTGIPVLNSERSDNYKLSWSQRLPHLLTRRLAKAVVANSHAGKRFAEALFNFKPDAVHVVWNGLRMEAIEQAKKAAVPNYRKEWFGSDQVKLACMVGNLLPPKDHTLALDTAAALVKQYPDWRVIFAGDQWVGGQEYGSQIMHKYELMQISDRVKFVGLRSDVLTLMRESDVVFSTSKREGFPNAILEAMGMGVPIVSTEVSDVRLILPFPWQVVSSRDPQLLVQAIIKAASCREIVLQRQQEWVEANATIEEAGKKLERIYFSYVSAPRVLPTEQLV